MSDLKYPQLRYKTLDKCFRNTVRRYFMEDLIEECENALRQYDIKAPGVSRRQIFEDIKFMESNLGWQIDLERKKEGKRVYYRYADPSFSINKMPLTEADLLQLQSAIQILSHFEGIPQFTWMEEMIKRIEYYLPIGAKNHTIISFDHNPYLHGVEYLSQLFHAIQYKRVLQITYQDFNSPSPYPIIVHPYYLKQYNNRWFLLGLHWEKRKTDWTLALDRIKGIVELPGHSYTPCLVNWDEYFEEMIGVTKSTDSPVSDVVLHFFGTSCNYVRTKALHGSQKIKYLKKDVLEVKLQVIHNFELEQQILSFGENVVVISPQSLANKISRRLQLTLENYSCRNNQSEASSC